MIRYYTYYSCGGYKDLFVGSDLDQADASYFIPLLNVWKKSNKPGMAEKIARAEGVQQVKLITNTDSFGFPTECNLMFSHGGYNAIYRTLSNGHTCFCIRDISNNARDEEGRNIPFNFLFLADGEDSIIKLDALALHYLSEENMIKNAIADAISYDPVINGMKFDLTKLNLLFMPDSHTPLNNLDHKNDSIDFIIIGSRKQYAMALSEQGIKGNMVNAMIDPSGIFHGAIAYHKDIPVHKKEQPSISKQITGDKNSCSDVNLVEDNLTLPAITDKNKSSVVQKEDTQAAPGIKSTSKQEQKTCDEDLMIKKLSDLKQTIESRTIDIRNAIAPLATKTDIDNLHEVLNKLVSQNQEEVKKILNTINERESVQSTLPVIAPNENPFNQLLNKNNLIISVLILIVGFILGALIF